MINQSISDGFRMVLIDTWWNVNVAHCPDRHMISIVLIDTWWNVNGTNTKANEAAKKVLIDTWWNVNYSSL